MTTRKNAPLWSCFYITLLLLSITSYSIAKPKFNYRVLEKPMLMKVRATAYTHTEPDHLAFGKHSAYGSYLRTGEKYHSAAADWSFLPIGTVFRMKEFGPTLFVVDDYGSALTGKGTVDIYFETEKEMNEWGAKNVEIEILRVGDYRASYMILRERARWPHCYKMAKRIYDRFEKLRKAAEEAKAKKPAE